jgi:two-component system NarL family response regulator
MTVRILLADDHQMFREALGNLLRAEADVDVVGETGNGVEVLSLTATLLPDLVCMDIHMPGMDGIEATRELRRIYPRIRVIALSAFTDQCYVLDMLAAGASGYVTKAQASDELLRAIRSVARGCTYLCPDVAGVVASAASAAPSSAGAQVCLSAREKQVATRVAQGQTSIQIADALFIAPSTVEVHRRNIMRKLGLRNAADLTRYVLSQDRYNA